MVRHPETVTLASAAAPAADLTHLSDRPMCIGCLVRLELQAAAEDAAMRQAR
jgi:hypothetical protein